MPTFIDRAIELPSESDLRASGIVIDRSVAARDFREVMRESYAIYDARERRMMNPHYMRDLAECAAWVRDIARGRVRNGGALLLELLSGERRLRETLSTSDFPLLFGDVISLRLLDQYTATSPIWPLIAQRGTVPDFRSARVLALDGLQSPLYAQKNEKPELTSVRYDDALTESGYTTSVKVYERGVSIAWRMLINQRGVGFLARLPQLLARSAARTEEKFAIDLFVNSGGYDTTFFSNTNKNIVNQTNGATANNPPLSIAGLRDAFTVLMLQQDSGGDPIEVAGATLLVPPHLAIQAQELVNAVGLERVPATSAEGTRVQTPNWARNLRVAVGYYLPIVDTSANNDTTWYLFADPNTSRPALEVTFLEGYEKPTLWQRTPDTAPIGGSPNPMMGSFDNSSIDYKVMHVLGGTLLDPKAAVVSNGTGS